MTVAWTWDSGYAPSGDDKTWAICDGSFTSGQEDEITLAANSWDAGSGEAMRGAIWNFIRGSDEASGTCDLDDGDDEVYMRSAAWFSSHGLATSTIANCFCDDWDGLNDTDIAFRSNVSWSDLVPASITTSGDRSIGQTALHEFGHLLGFLHEDDLIATMNSEVAFGGDISGHKYRPHEDDYVGLVANRPDSSTGRNMMLGRFVEDPSDPGSTDEVWDVHTTNWSVCDEEIDGADGPEEIYAIMHATAAQTVEIEWRLSADTTCFAGTEYVVGSRTTSLGSNTPFLIQPHEYDFTGVPAGSYYLCAMVDPDDLISETNSSDSDNDLRSEATVTVSNCP